MVASTGLPALTSRVIFLGFARPWTNWLTVSDEAVAKQLALGAVVCVDDLGRGAVLDSDVEALGGNVECEVLPHDGEPDQTDLGELCGRGGGRRGRDRLGSYHVQGRATGVVSPKTPEPNVVSGGLSAK